MEAQRYESLLREGAAAIQQSRLLKRSADGIRKEPCALAVASRRVVADSKRVIDLLFDHVLCDDCLMERAELPPARFRAVWDELTRRFTSAQAIAAVCEECGEDKTLHRLVS